MEDPATRPVLFLRSFAQDLEVPPIFSVDAQLLQEWSLEDIIATWLRPIAPVVAFGVPGERLAPADLAARLYVSGDQWQDKVRAIAQRSRLVVAVPAATAGVLWELRFIRENVEPERVMLALGRRTDAGFAQLRSLAEQELRTELPPLAKIKTGDGYWIPREQFYIFSQGWKAQLLPVQVTQTDPKGESTELGFSLADGSCLSVKTGKLPVRDYTAAFAPVVARLAKDDPRPAPASQAAGAE
ncbi:MAG TPA: hypothetical protein VGW39_00620 [Chthoniobacterales bacterium]|nr:hypothetical protein [Chthoniobacterales bacterium]